MATSRFHMQPAPLPDALAGSLEKLVFFYVRQADGATVYELRDALDVPQIQLYPTIDRLASRGLLDCHGDEVRPAEPTLG